MVDYVSKCLHRNFDLNDHHTQPYDECVRVWLRDIIQQYGTVTTQYGDKLYMFEMSRYRFVRGATLPSEAHRFNDSYTAMIHVDIQETVYAKSGAGPPSEHEDFPVEVLNKKHSNVPLSQFPMMLFSKACYFSDGLDHPKETEYAGGMIVKGKRRFIPMLKALVTNFPFRFYNKTTNLHYIQVRSEHLDHRHRSTSTLEVCMGAGHKRSVMTRAIVVKIPFLNVPLPMGILALALGTPVSEFLVMVKQSLPNMYDPVLFLPYELELSHNCQGCTTQDAALRYICQVYSKPNTNSASNMLRNEILPHTNQQPVEAKVVYLAYMSAMLILFHTGRLTATDRDARDYARLTDAGTSLAILFRMLFINFRKQGVKILRRCLSQQRPVDVRRVFNEKRLSPKILSAVATGTWSKKRKGVSHPMTTGNDQAIISQLRRVSSSCLNNDGKHIGPRMVKSFGYECAAETPEGEGCGLIYSLASFTRVTMSSDTDLLLEYLTLVDADLLSAVPQGYKLFDGNGRLAAWCSDPDQFVQRFRDRKRQLQFDPYVSLVRDDTLAELRILTDIGRMARPLLVVANLHKLPQLVRARAEIATLLAHGVIEYVTPAEERNYQVSLDPRRLDKCTHLEVGDVAFVGIIAAMAPFFRHNQGPRLVYWVGMAKQTIGSTLGRDKGSITTHNLWYGQRALVHTKTAVDLNLDKTADCINVTIAFFPHSYNQEDAIVMNRASIDKGMFVSDSTRIYSLEKEIGSNTNTAERFENPDPKNTFDMCSADYSKLQPNGMPKVGTTLGSGDVVIGKTLPAKQISAQASVNLPPNHVSARQPKRRDKSILVRHDECGTVSSVFMGSKNNCTFAKVHVKTVRIPEVGDKFSSRHAQKGTIGKVEEPENMPFEVKTGMIPDILMSPLGITSRMTMGKVLEIIMGKAAAITGDLLHGFDDQDFNTPIEERMKVIQEVLRRAGFSGSGKERFRNGMTGELIEVPVMFGLVAYCKLNHMVSRKIHARATGPTHALTRQPNKGRQQGGGLRFGMMESECVVAHSAAEILRERTVTASDAFDVAICGQCGFMADANEELQYYHCRTCKTGKHVRMVELGFATKLMLQELMATGVKPCFTLKDVQQ